MYSLTGREKAVVRPAERESIACPLALADRHRTTVVPRSLEHAERHRVDVRDRERARRRRRVREVRRRLEAAEEIGLLKDGAGRLAAGGAKLVRIGEPIPMGHLDHLETEPRRVGLHHLPDLRVDRLGEHDLRAARDVSREEAGIGSDDTAVVAGRVRHVHRRQLADRSLVLEDRLQHALAHLGLIRRVRGQELAA